MSMLPRIQHWVLEGAEHRPVVAENYAAWGRWMAENDRRVARTVLGPWEVSTVFLGLDHRLAGKGPPILFETMTFLTERDADGHLQEVEIDDAFARYSSWDDAATGHKAIVGRLQRRLAETLGVKRT